MPQTISRNPSVTNLSCDIPAYTWPNNNADASHPHLECADGPRGACQAFPTAKNGWIPLPPTGNWLGKRPGEGKPVTIWAVWIATPTRCWLENKPASSWLQGNLLQNLPSLKWELKARWKTPWSSAAPLKGGGIKTGLLGMFGFFLIHGSRQKMQEKLTESNHLAQSQSRWGFLVILAQDLTTLSKPADVKGRGCCGFPQGWWPPGKLESHN